MYPILFKLGNFTIHTYGFFVATGFLTGIFLAKHEAKRVGEDSEKITDLCFYVLIAAIIGSRIFYVLTNLKYFAAEPLDVFKIWNGGLVFYGGFIAALIVLLVYLKKHGMPLWKILDIAAPSLALGHFFGRLGCFSAGCCYGKLSDLPWAVTFTNPDSLAPLGVPLHPTQLYSAANNLLIFGFLLFFKRVKKFEGQLFWIYVLLYGITRSIIEIFRGDPRGGLLFGILSVSQTIGALMSIIAVFMLVVLGRRAAEVSEKNA